MMLCDGIHKINQTVRKNASLESIHGASAIWLMRVNQNECVGYMHSGAAGSTGNF